MNFDSVTFHNVGDSLPVDDSGGIRLQRVPESVRMTLNPGAQEKMLMPANVEIRFITDRDRITITLSVEEGECEIVPFWGPFQGPERYSVGTEPEPVEITRPERFARFDADGQRAVDSPFSHRVWRLVPTSPGLSTATDTLYAHGIDGPVRPPTAEEVPSRRCLAYGTSITQGVGASQPHLSYAAQLARRLDADLINLGSAGSGYCEPEIADYIAERDDWDLAVLEISTNMIGTFSEAEFRHRARYLIATIAEAHPDDPVYCLTILPQYKYDSETLETFREGLRTVVDSLDYENVHLVDGPRMLDFEGLTADLVHPGDAGMAQIGARLAAEIERLG